MAAMTSMQRLVVVLMMLVICMAAVWMVQLVAKPNLDLISWQRPLSSEEVATIESELAALDLKEGPDYRIRNGDFYVRPALRQKVLGRISFSGAIAGNTVDFSKLFEQSDLLRTGEQNKRLWMVAKQNELAGWLLNFPRVKSAKVIIDTGQQRMIGRNQQNASASVFLQMEGAIAPDKSLIHAAANTVAGAVSALKPENVSVTCNGQFYPIASDADVSNTQYLQIAREYEQAVTQKIRQLLPPIDGVRISVHVDPDVTRKVIDSTEYQKDKSLLTPIREKEQNSNQDSTQADQPPGAVPNIGMALFEASGNSSSTAEAETEYENYPGQKRLNVVDPGGQPKRIAASLQIPRTYYVEIAKAESGEDNQEPDEAAVAAVEQREGENFRQSVAMGIGAKVEDVKVSMYYDDVVLGAITVPVVGEGMVASLMSRYGKLAVMGGLALMALMMVLMTIRKVTPTPVTFGAGDGVEAAVAEEAMTIEPDGDGILPGLEVDKDDLRSARMAEQVETLVKDNPDVAANLIRSWMKQEG